MYLIRTHTFFKPDWSLCADTQDKEEVMLMFCFCFSQIGHFTVDVLKNIYLGTDMTKREKGDNVKIWYKQRRNHSSQYRAGLRLTDL